jgi:uncharacterized protein (TIGR02611 family)
MSMARLPGGGTAKRIGLEALGWVLVVVGIAALILPGPGLLMLFGGLAVLSQQYEWAERRVRPVEIRAKRAAAESVQTWPRIVISVLATCWVLVTGLLWLLRPSVPGWWPFENRWWAWFVKGKVPDWWPFEASWWFIGDWPAAVTLVASALVAFALIVYSYRTYRGVDPSEVEDTAAAEG